MELYLHIQGKELAIVEVDGDDVTVDELCDEHLGEGAAAWLEDDHKKLQPKKSLVKAGVTDRAHVHISRCHKVDVTVRYAGNSVDKDFAPGTTINMVFDWAVGKKGFALAPPERAKHALALTGATDPLDKAEHVGSLATECALALDLISTDRFAG